MDAMKQWFSDMQKELFVLGPLLPPGYGIETQKGEEGASVEIETFLGEMLEQHGKASVFFVKKYSFPFSSAIPTKIWFFSLQISFGTNFFPSEPEYVEELIEALIEKKAPYVSDGLLFHAIFFIMIQALFYQIFSCASPFAKISEQLIEKIKSSGLGKLTTWSPQQFILNHPVLYPQ
jgi:hypothetical protein